MTAEELKQAKKQLQNEIAASVKGFVTDTGVLITGVAFDVDRNRSIGMPRAERVCVSVTVELDI